MTSNPRISRDNPRIVSNVKSIKQINPVSQRRVTTFDFRLNSNTTDELSHRRKTTRSRKSENGITINEKSYVLIDYENDEKIKSKLANSKAELSQRISNAGNHSELKQDDANLANKVDSQIIPGQSFKNIRNQRISANNQLGQQYDYSKKSMSDKIMQTSLAEKNNGLSGTKEPDDDQLVFYKKNIEPERFHKGLMGTTDTFDKIPSFKPRTAQGVRVNGNQITNNEEPILKEQQIDINSTLVSDLNQKSTKPESFYQIPDDKETSKIDKISIPSSNLKKQLTPIKNSKGYVEIKEPNKFHQICKKPTHEHKTRSISPRLASNSPKIKQDFFQKHPEFVVKQYKKLENMNSNSPNPNRNLVENSPMDDVIKRNVKLTPLRIDQTQKNKNNPNCTCGKRIPVLPDVQFCQFCHSYIHPECFEKFFKN